MNETACLHCGRSFSYPSSGTERKFCSVACYRAHPRGPVYDWNGTRNLKPKKDPLPLWAGNWAGTGASSVCAVCKREFSHPSTRSKEGARYCSADCSRQASRYAFEKIFNRTPDVLP